MNFLKIFIIIASLFLSTAYAGVNCSDHYGAVTCAGGYVVLNSAGTAYTCATATQVSDWDSYCSGATNSVAVNCLSTRVTDAANQPRACTCNNAKYSYTTATYSCSICASGYKRYPTCSKAISTIWDSDNGYFLGEQGDGTDVWGSMGGWERNSLLNYIFPETLTDKLGIGTETPNAQIHSKDNLISGEYVTEIVSEYSTTGTNNLASIISRSNDSSLAILSFTSNFDGAISGGGSYGHFAGRSALWAGVYPTQSDAGLSILTDGLDIVSATGDIRIYTGGIGTSNEVGRILNNGQWLIGQTSGLAGAELDVQGTIISDYYTTTGMICTSGSVDCTSGDGLYISSSIISTIPLSNYPLIISASDGVNHIYMSDSTTWGDDGIYINKYSNSWGANQTSPKLSLLGIYNDTDNGTADGGGSNYLEDVGIFVAGRYDDNAYQSTKCQIEITSGTGSGQTKQIDYNTADRIYIEGTWSVNPSSDSVYTVSCAYRPQTKIFAQGALRPFLSFNVAANGYDDKDADVINAAKLYSDEFNIVYKLSLTPSDIVEIVDSNGITSAQMTNTNLRIQSASAGNCDIYSTPQIADGVDGQELRIECQDDTKTVQFDEGDGLDLDRDISFTCGEHDVLKLVYNSDDDVWVEDYRKDN